MRDMKNTAMSVLTFLIFVIFIFLSYTGKVEFSYFEYLMVTFTYVGLVILFEIEGKL